VSFGLKPSYFIGDDVAMETKFAKGDDDDESEENDEEDEEMANDQDEEREDSDEEVDHVDVHIFIILPYYVADDPSRF